MTKSNTFGPHIGSNMWFHREISMEVLERLKITICLIYRYRGPCVLDTGGSVHVPRAVQPIPGIRELQEDFWE